MGADQHHRALAARRRRPSYVAATRYKHDDTRPYLFKTTDYGETWTRITNGIPADDFTRVIREDPSRRGLLYAGTETGIYVSLRRRRAPGSRLARQPARSSPIHDLIVKDGDLVVATHGRSFWILDDLTPLHQLADAVATRRRAPLRAAPHRAVAGVPGARR